MGETIEGEYKNMNEVNILIPPIVPLFGMFVLLAFNSDCWGNEADTHNEHVRAYTLI